MEFHLVKTTDKADVFALSGHLGLDAVQKAESKFKKEVGRSKKNVVLDLSGVVFISSFGVRLFLDVLQTLEKDGKKMLLVSPQPSVKELLVNCEMDTLAGIYDSVDAALAAM
jgi:anti-anti-sigma factor